MTSRRGTFFRLPDPPAAYQAPRWYERPEDFFRLASVMCWAGLCSRTPHACADEYWGA